MLFLPCLALAVPVQNPNDPYLVPAPGWKVVFHTELGEVKPPRRELKSREIQYPPYGLGMEAAGDVRKREPKATFVSAFLGGRSVEAALTADGSLTVSFGWRRPHEHASDAPVSYATKVTTAREAAVALVVVLSRLDAPERDPNRPQLPKRSPDAPTPHRSVPGDPFNGEVSLPEGYAQRGRSKSMLGVAQFVSPTGPKIELLQVMSTHHGSQPGEMPDRVGWNEGAMLLGGRLAVRTDAGIGLSARFDPPDDGPSFRSIALFRSKSETPAAALITIFAALSYVRPKG